MLAAVGVGGFDGVRVSPKAATAVVREATEGSSVLNDEDEGFGEVGGFA